MKSILDFLFVKKGIMIFVFVAFILVGFFGHSRRGQELSKYEFNGRIEDILYDIKEIPTVTVKKKKYYLDAWGFNYRLSIGDSIIKRKDEMIIKIIKKETGKEILLLK